MKARHLTLAVAGLCVFCWVSFSAEPKPHLSGVWRLNSQKSQSQDGGAQDLRPAEEVYKNIQVMKGVPASRLPVAMAFFSKALGVDCEHCHVPSEFEKDDNPAKSTARRMLQMVHQINDNNFAPDHPISCWTCHRGSVKPESFPK